MTQFALDRLRGPWLGRGADEAAERLEALVGMAARFEREREEFVSTLFDGGGVLFLLLSCCGGCGFAWRRFRGDDGHIERDRLTDQEGRDVGALRRRVAVGVASGLPNEMAPGRGDRSGDDPACGVVTVAPCLAADVIASQKVC